jgi:hypothetical protein
MYQYLLIYVIYIYKYPSYHLIVMMMMCTYKGHNDGVTKSNSTQKYRPAKGISKRVNV